VFQTRPDANDVGSLTGFLTDLAGPSVRPTGHVDPRRAVIAPIGGHDGLAGYPTAVVWDNLKAVELADLRPDTLDEPQTTELTGLERIGSSYELLFAFLDHTGLPL
jgi:hypothetical protein